MLLLAAVLPPLASTQTSAAPAPALIYYGGMPSRLTMERDGAGGNPFASGLIEVLKEPGLTLRAFGTRLAAATFQHSGGWQSPDIPRSPKPADWTFEAQEAGQKVGSKVALVVAVWDYAASSGLKTLEGSRFDADRVALALTEAGFSVGTIVAPDRAGLTAALDAFAGRSAEAEAALVYVTGHGVQHRKTAYLIMGNYPSRSAAHLPSHAVSVPEFAGAARARRVNLVLFAGCRDDPFPQ